MFVQNRALTLHYRCTFTIILSISVLIALPLLGTKWTFVICHWSIMSKLIFSSYCVSDCERTAINCRVFGANDSKRLRYRRLRIGCMLYVLPVYLPSLFHSKCKETAVRFCVSLFFPLTKLRYKEGNLSRQTQFISPFETKWLWQS